jgi:putative sporulation protein YyaC
MLDRFFDMRQPQSELKFSVHQPHGRQEFAATIRHVFKEATATGRVIVILCIGTDRSTGDALGPLTGSRLQSLNVYPYIFGTLDNPVHAANLPEAIHSLSVSFANPYIVAVDACLGRLESVGCVTVGRGPLRPGAAVNKDLPPVGDICITGIVNVGGFMEHLVLQSTRLNLVVKMADTIAGGLACGLEEIEKGISVG